MTELEEELYHIKNEIKSRHEAGVLVPSWLYEMMHTTEKMIRFERHKEKQNERKSVSN